MFYGRIYVAGNNRTYVGLRIKCPTFLPDFNQTLRLSTHFLKPHPHLYQISRKSVQYMLADGPTDMMKLIGVFRDYANAPEDQFLPHSKKTLCLHKEDQMVKAVWENSIF